MPICTVSARESNEASETVVPTTFVDDAELVWRLTAEHTQQQVADSMGWSRGAVSNYAALQGIDAEAWKVVATTLQVSTPATENDDVADIATPVATPFSENLLRNILDLEPAQQLALCQLLAKSKSRKRWAGIPASMWRAIRRSARECHDDCIIGAGPGGS